MNTLAEHLPRTNAELRLVLEKAPVTPEPKQRVHYVYNASFDDPSQREAILADMPGARAYEAQRREALVPADVPPELAPLCTPILSREQEQHLFRKLNFLKHQAGRLRDYLHSASGRVDACGAAVGIMDTINNLHGQAQELRAFLINCNTRLLVSIVKRYSAPNGFFERMSDGNLSLISAVEKFDYSRGYKFSTYASSVIMRSLARNISKEKHRSQRFRTGHESSFFEAFLDPRSDEKTCLTTIEQARACLNRLLRSLEYLNPRELQIVRLRHGLDNNGIRTTFVAISKKMGVTKERVRQLYVRAMKKLRNLAVENCVEFP